MRRKGNQVFMKFHAQSGDRPILVVKTVKPGPIASDVWIVLEPQPTGSRSTPPCDLLNVAADIQMSFFRFGKLDSWEILYSLQTLSSPAQWCPTGFCWVVR
jgi:hypothetical protein